MRKTDDVQVAFVVPMPIASTPPAARLGLLLRAEATILGRCVCGGVREGDAVWHECGCPAASAAVERAVAREQVAWAAVRGSMPAAEVVEAAVANAGR